MQLFTKNYNFVWVLLGKSTSLLPVLSLTLEQHLCYSFPEIKLDNAKMASREVSLLVCSKPKFESQWLHFMGVEKSFSMSFLIPNFQKKELRKMNEEKQNATDLDLSILDLNFYRIIYQRILSLKKSKEKGGESNVLSTSKSV